MYYYIPDSPDKTTCIGNTLSTFNISFSSLDSNLYELSTYSVNSVNYLSSTMVSVSSTLDSRINYLSSTMVSVSSQIQTNILNTSSFLFSELGAVSSFIEAETDYLSSQVQFVSSNVINNYIRQGIVYNISGVVDWDFSANGNNATLILSSNVTLNNPTNLSAGQTGNLVVKISTDGASITSYGNLWTFSNYTSAMVSTLSSKNVISYYYDGEQILGNILTFNT